MIILLIFSFLSPNSVAHAADCDSIYLNTYEKSLCEMKTFDESKNKVINYFNNLISDPKSKILESKLNKSQASWSEFVDTECDLEADLTFGSAGSFVIFQCKIKLYIKRFGDLEKIKSEIDEQP